MHVTYPAVAATNAAAVGLRVGPRQGVMLMRIQMVAGVLYVAAMLSCTQDDKDSNGDNGSGSTDAGNTSTSSSGTQQPTAQSACHEFAESYCNKFASCLPTNEMGYYFGGTDSCPALMENICLSGLLAPGTSKTINAVKQCATALQSVACDKHMYDAMLLYSVYGGSIEGVDGCTFGPGTADDGAACVESSQCKSQLCRISSGSACGACASRAPVGQACTQDMDCQVGLRCANKTCVVPVGEGQTCDFYRIACQPGTTCVNASGSSKCRAPGGTGAPCFSMWDCSGELRCVSSKCAEPIQENGRCRASGECKTGLTCVSETCQLYVLSTGGQSCAGPNNTTMPCENFMMCTQESKLCPVVAHAGGSCGPDINTACERPAQCVSGTCVLPACP